jgi:uncharacterized oligopeptide transporter (OPT) family protein
MALFQRPAATDEEVAKSRPLDVGPEQVLPMDEREWYARVYRGDDVPQLTVRAVAMGCGLGFLLAFTNLYIGLKTGWYLAVAITACILSYSVWNALVRAGVARSPMSILESNCMQSCASCAGYGTGTTIITAIPAMLMLSATPDDPRGHNLPWWFVALWTFVLACLGGSLAIPMKRNMINREKLRFPEGTAAAVMLQSLYGAGREALLKARALYAAAFVGALMPMVKDVNWRRTLDDQGKPARAPLIADSASIFDWLPAVHGSPWSAWTLRLDFSFLLVGAGVIVGLRVAASMMLGALLLIVVVGPHALDAQWTNALGKVVAAARGPGTAWKDIGIWFGAPLMVSYGLVAFATQGKMVARAFRGMGAGGATGDADPSATRDVEVPLSWFVVGAGASSIAAIVVAWLYFDIPVLLAALAVALSFVLTLVASRATGETSVTPSGPLGKIVQLTYGALMPQNGA